MSAKPKPKVTERQREAARATAKRLMEEGRWGGRGPGGKDAVESWGQGGSPRPKFVPSARMMLGLLQAVEDSRGVGHTDELRMLFAKLARPLCGVPRKAVYPVVVEALSRALAGGLIPQKVVFRGNAVVDLLEVRGPWRPRVKGEKEWRIPDPRESDFRKWREPQLAEGLVLLSDVHVYPTTQAAKARKMVDELLGRVHRAVDDEVERRGVEVPSRVAF